MNLLDKILDQCYLLGLSLEQLSIDSDVSINDLKTWNETVPNPNHLQKVANTLHVSVDFLNGETDNKRPADKSNRIHLWEMGIDVFGEDEVSDEQFFDIMKKVNEIKQTKNHSN